jgi:hypothetical protein
MAGAQSGLIAELAYAVAPRLNLLVGTLGTVALTIASDDILAADLGWLAVAPVDPDRESVGAWEHPAIQRAAAMGFGLPGPTFLDLRVLAHPTAESDRRRIESQVRLA